MKRNNKKGFTIVELVIVIAVIAILSAVLIPTFGNVIENAQESAAQQEVKNIHTLYLADIDYANGGAAETVYIVHEGKTYSVAVDGKITSDATIPDEYRTEAIDNLPEGSSVYVKCTEHKADANDHCEYCEKIVGENHDAANCPDCTN